MIPLQTPSLPPPWVTRPVIITFPAHLRASPTRDNAPPRTKKISFPTSWRLSLAKLNSTLISALATTHKISAFSLCTPVPVRIPLNWTLIFCIHGSRSITRVPPWPVLPLGIPSHLNAPHQTHYPPTPPTRLDSMISLRATSQHCISRTRHCIGPTHSGEAPG